MDYQSPLLIWNSVTIISIQFLKDYNYYIILLIVSIFLKLMSTLSDQQLVMERICLCCLKSVFENFPLTHYSKKDTVEKVSLKFASIREKIVWNISKYQTTNIYLFIIQVQLNYILLQFKLVHSFSHYF